MKSVFDRLRTLPKPLVFWSILVGLLAVIYVVQLSERPVKAEQRMEERLAEDKSVAVKYYTAVYWWKGAWLSLPVCILLLVLGKWITRPLSADFKPEGSRAPPGAAKYVFLSTLVAVILGGVLNAPRLTFSLWDDEAYSVRKYVVGSHERDKRTYEMEFDQPTWLETMFDLRKPTNHILFSAAARVSHSFYEQGDGPKDQYVSEWHIRLPSYIGGLVGLAGLSWFLFTFGFYRAAKIAPFLLLVHAWFARMGVDARGYAFVLAFSPLLLASLSLALRTGRWRWWIAFLIFESLLFLSFFGSVYFIFGVNVTALGLIFFRKDTSTSDKWSLFWRFTGVSGLFGLFFIFYVVPALPMINAYIATGRFMGDMDLKWWQDMGGFLVSGAPWFDEEPANPLSYHLAEVVADYGVLAWLAIGVFVASILSGIIALAFSRRWPWLVALLCAIPLAYFHNYIEERRLIHWYGVIALPGLIALASIGATAWSAHLKGRMVREGAAALCGLVLIGCVFSLASRYNHLLRTRSFVALRESGEATGKEVINPLHPDFEKDGVLTVGFHQPSILYDPGVWWFWDPETSGQQFRKIIERADREGRPLYVNFGLYEQAKIFHKEIMDLVANEEVFEEVAILYGLYGASTRYVYRYRPGSLSEGE